MVQRAGGGIMKRIDICKTCPNIVRRNNLYCLKCKVDRMEARSMESLRRLFEKKGMSFKER